MVMGARDHVEVEVGFQDMPDARPVGSEQGQRLEDDWVPAEDARPLEEIEAATRKEEARNRRGD